LYSLSPRGKRDYAEVHHFELAPGCQAAIEGVARSIHSRERVNLTIGLKPRPIVSEPPKVKMRSPFSGYFPKMV